MQHITTASKQSEDSTRITKMQDITVRRFPRRAFLISNFFGQKTQVQGFVKVLNDEERFRTLKYSNSYYGVAPIKTLPWSFATIKGNMLFKFNDETVDRMCIRIDFNPIVNQDGWHGERSLP